MKLKTESEYMLEVSADLAESMGADFLSLIECLNNALYIGKYLSKHKGTYKKDKKRIEKVLKSTEDGYFAKYMDSEWSDEKGN